MRINRLECMFINLLEQTFTEHSNLINTKKRQSSEQRLQDNGEREALTTP